MVFKIGLKKVEIILQIKIYNRNGPNEMKKKSEPYLFTLKEIITEKITCCTNKYISMILL